ncbi:MAG: serine hydrolase domain-containing protein [Actinomycetes bacterium]
MSTPLPRSSPAAQQVDPRALLTFVEAVDADPAVELHSVMVLRHGHVVAEGWWAPHTPERTRQLYSLSKSFTSAALGLALNEGLVSLDETVVSHFPEYADDVTDRRTRSMTLRHLASMAAGHTRDLLDEVLAADPDDPVRGFLRCPPDEEPGTVFAYSQPCTYTLASILQRVTGTTLSDYLRPRLLDPLGVGETGWLTWPPGREQGFSGLFATTEDVARLGQLLLQRGRWEGVQLLPEEYVDQATSKQVDNPHEENPDWRQGYGFQFWMARHGYRGDGAFGQFCIVLPEQDVVVATTGGTEQMQAVLDHLWTLLLPGLGSAVADQAAEQRLAERLSGLRLAPRLAWSAPANPHAWAGRSFPVAASDRERAAPVVAVEVVAVDGDLEVTLAESDNRITFPVGSTDWVVSEPRDARGQRVPVAASGGWAGEDTLHVELIFLESPHRLDVACSLSLAEAEVGWRTTPLGGAGLESLHRPR